MGNPFSSESNIAVGQPVLIHRLDKSYQGTGRITDVNRDLMIVTIDAIPYQFLSPGRWSAIGSHFYIDIGETYEEAVASGTFVKLFRNFGLALPEGVIVPPEDPQKVVDAEKAPEVIDQKALPLSGDSPPVNDVKEDNKCPCCHCSHRPMPRMIPIILKGIGRNGADVNGIFQSMTGSIGMVRLEPNEDEEPIKTMEGPIPSVDETPVTSIPPITG